MQVQGIKGKRKPKRKSTPRFLEQTSEGGQDLNRIEPRTVDLPLEKERRESGVWKRGRNRGDAESEKGIAQVVKISKAKARQNEYSKFFCAREDNCLCRLLAPPLWLAPKKDEIDSE